MSYCMRTFLLGLELAAQGSPQRQFPPQENLLSRQPWGDGCQLGSKLDQWQVSHDAAERLLHCWCCVLAGDVIITFHYLRSSSSSTYNILITYCCCSSIIKIKVLLLYFFFIIAAVVSLHFPPLLPSPSFFFFFFLIPTLVSIFTEVGNQVSFSCEKRQHSHHHLYQLNCSSLCCCIVCSVSSSYSISM